MDNYKQVKFVNLPISSLGLCDKSTSDFIEMMRDLEMTTDQTSFIIKRIMNVAIRTSYFILYFRHRLKKFMNYYNLCQKPWSTCIIFAAH